MRAVRFPDPNTPLSALQGDFVYADPSSLPTGLALAAVMGAAMAFGIGANDAANSWGTTVGSGVRLERGVPRREVQGLKVQRSA